MQEIEINNRTYRLHDGIADYRSDGGCELCVAYKKDSFCVLFGLSCMEHTQSYWKEHIKIK